MNDEEWKRIEQLALCDSGPSEVPRLLDPAGELIDPTNMTPREEQLWNMALAFRQNWLNTYRRRCELQAQVNRMEKAERVAERVAAGKLPESTQGNLLAELDKYQNTVTQLIVLDVERGLTDEQRQKLWNAHSNLFFVRKRIEEYPAMFGENHD